MIIDRSLESPLRRTPGLLDRAVRRLVTRKLAELHGGEITIADASGTSKLGTGGDLHATLHVREPRFYRQAALGGSLGAANSYLQGDWDCDSLTALFRLFVRNSAAAGSFGSRLVATRAAGSTGSAIGARPIRRAGSRRNIRAHYDLGNDFFQLWLDDTWAYSCGIFASPNATLREASIEKFDRVCRKLDLRPTDHLLEIGTGWGGLAIHAANPLRMPSDDDHHLETAV